MSTVMDEDIKRWTSRRKSALVMEIFVSVRPSHLFPDPGLRHPFTHVQHGG